MDREELEELVFNLDSSSVRYDTLNGRKHIIIPTVMITTGVHDGNKGPVLYDDELLSNSPDDWNHIPIVVNHPKKGTKGISARKPEVLQKTQVGLVFNNKHEDGKWAAESWIDIQKMDEIDDTVLTRISRNTPVEVSTGMYTQITNEKGNYKGTDYVGKVKSVKPDHLAILPNTKGACPVSKGAGLLQNEGKGLDDPLINDVSLKDLNYKIYCCLREDMKTPGYMWMGSVEDIFSDYFVYNDGDGCLYKQGYKATEKEITLEGDPIAVARKVSYVLTENSVFIANASGYSFTLEEGSVMATKLVFNAENHVNTLIKSGSWAEEDREFLTKMDPKKLEKIKAPETPTTNEKGKGKKKEETETDNDELTNNEGNEKPVKAKPVALKDLDPATQRLLARAKKRDDEERVKFVEEITANENNRFTTEMLEDKSTDELEALADLARPVMVENQSRDDDDSPKGSGFLPRRPGQGGSITVNRSCKETTDTDPLPEVE